MRQRWRSRSSALFWTLDCFKFIWHHHWIGVPKTQGGAFLRWKSFNLKPSSSMLNFHWRWCDQFSVTISICLQLLSETKFWHHARHCSYFLQKYKTRLFSLGAKHRKVPEIWSCLFLRLCLGVSPLEILESSTEAPPSMWHFLFELEYVRNENILKHPRYHLSPHEQKAFTGALRIGVIIQIHISSRNLN